MRKRRIPLLLFNQFIADREMPAQQRQSDAKGEIGRKIGQVLRFTTLACLLAMIAMLRKHEAAGWCARDRGVGDRAARRRQARQKRRLRPRRPASAHGARSGHDEGSDAEPDFAFGFHISAMCSSKRLPAPWRR